MFDNGLGWMDKTEDVEADTNNWLINKKKYPIHLKLTNNIVFYNN